jgi:UDPglucose--hexose-1-phosphate uridylyltransferase
MMDVAAKIEKLLRFGLEKGLMAEDDLIFARNQIIDMLGLSAPGGGDDGEALPETATSLLAPLVDYAVEKGIIGDTVTERELFDTRLMGAMMPRPSEVRRYFKLLYDTQGPKAATDWFYGLCRRANYIRVDQIARNIAWRHDTAYGPMTITINLSKPEKDPKEIAKLKNAPAAGYPACMLCPQNEGYAGRLNFPARQTLRLIPVTLAGEPWFFQYSPYVYYPEHCIVLKAEHTPMKIDRGSFSKLLDFIDQFPHYFIGSNAGIPVVGGSILNHEHFQGGCFELPMAAAKKRCDLTFRDFPGIKAQILDWPMTVIRLASRDRRELLDAADMLHETWWRYDDPAHQIRAAEADGTPHNTFTPIARRRGEAYEMDLVLRNNVATDQFPLGIFHPHPHLHHIKRENIGLVEVMGLFILPGRLEKELEAIAQIWAGLAEMPGDIGEAEHPLNKHLPWMNQLLTGRPTLEEAREAIRRSVGNICVDVLRDCAVYKDDREGLEGLSGYLAACGGTLEK